MPPARATSQYQSEHSSSSSCLRHTHGDTSSSPSSIKQKVVDWLPTTLTSSSNLIGYPLSPAQSPDRRKMVHWTSDVEDDKKAPRRSSKSKSSKSSSSSTKSSSSKSSGSSSSSSKRKSSSSSSTDDSRSRVPPAAPRSARLPTPDLSDIEHGDFCDCCPPTRQTAKQKMDSQLDAAMAHIAAAKQRGY